MTCPRCQTENPAHAKFCLECASSLKGDSPLAESYAALRAKVKRLTGALSEAHDQQTATAEILGVISSSPTDVQPVFDAIADSAMRLLAAWSTSVWRHEEGLIRLVAARGGLPGSSETFMKQRQSPTHPAHDSPASQTVLTRMVFHSADVDADPSWGPPFRAEAKMRGFRSIVAVPMLRGKDAVGVIAVTGPKSGASRPPRPPSSRLSLTRPSSRSRTSACSRSCRKRIAR